MENNNVDASVILPILKKIPLFADLDENLHREIIAQIVLMYYPADYTIFNEGDAGDALYIIKKGQVEVFHPSKAEGELLQKVADIGDGGFFGEMALVSETPRNASVKTTADTEVFILSKKNFSELLQTNTSLAEQISATTLARMKDNEKQI